MCLPAIRSGPYNFQSSGISTEEICYKTFVVMGEVIYIVHTGFGIVIEKNTIVYLNILSLLPHYMKCISTEHQCYNCGKFFHFFRSHLFLPISSEIMDGFWCLRCLNNRLEVPDMMRSFSGGATSPLVVKNWTKQPWLKIENLRDFDRNFTLSRGKI